MKGAAQPDGGLAFRRAAPGDIAAIRTLADRIWRASYATLLSPGQIEHMLAWMYGPDTIAAELASGVVWEVALREDEPVGYLSVVHGPGIEAELKKLYLDADFQGRGFGQSMLKRAGEIAQASGCTTLRLRVNKGNARALRAYERAGFQVIDTVVEDIGRGFVMDDFVLARPVPLPTADSLGV